ncbi:MAG TPA: HEAT repeat domain-containing protein [Planctomycetota bacterium]
MRIAALVVPLLALLTWASWPAPFPPLDPEDAEAIRLVRDLERGREGARAAIIRARNPRTVPALMAFENEDTLREILHPVDAHAPSELCCLYGQRPHPAVDAFERALQSALQPCYGGGSLKDRGCARFASLGQYELMLRLDDPEPGIHFAAAFQLWRSEHPRLVPRVLGLLGEHSFARYPWLEPVAAILRRETSEGEILAGVGKGSLRELAAAAFLKRRAAVEEIVRGLNNPARKGGWPDLAWTLGEIGDQRAAGALIDALSSGEYWLTGDAAEALAKIGDRSALPALRGALDRAGVYGQAEILRAIGKLGGPEDIPQVEYYATTAEYTGAIGRRRVAQDALKKLRP